MQLDGTASSDPTTVDALRYTGASWKILVGVCLLVALPMLTFIGWPLFWGLSSQTWPSVMGQVTHSHYEVRNDYHIAEITYKYHIGNREAENDRISYGGSPNDADVQKLVEAHPHGSSIAVYYDPTNITRSALITGTSPWDWLLFSIGLAMLGLCVLLWKKRPSPQQDNLFQIYQITESAAKIKGPISGKDVMSWLFR